MYIACDNCLARGYFLGDVLTMIKCAWLFAGNEPHDHYLLSLMTGDPLNFLWDRFIRENDVEVFWEDYTRGDRLEQYRRFDQRRAARAVYGVPFDTYKELSPRLDGGGRQGTLCGREAGLCRRNILEYYYFGQETSVAEPYGTVDFGPPLIDVPDVVYEPCMADVFVAPHEKCQGNRVFTLAFWEQTIRALLAAGLTVEVNDGGGFMRDAPGVSHSFLPFDQLAARVASAPLVACGNTGVGWLAAALGVPFVAADRNWNFAEYTFAWSGCRSLRRTITEPAPAAMLTAIMAAEWTPTGVLGMGLLRHFP